MKISYMTIEAHLWIMGKTWWLSALEDGELEFLTEWIQYK